jgi:Uma2 family endonuclease
MDRMNVATEPKRLAISIETFRAFYESRPEEEHWELIDGRPMMMAPPTKTHQRIASNLERLLNDALEAHHPAWAAYQRSGVNLRPDVDNYDPEPDVVVVDVTETLDERYSDRFYLAAEVVSESDSTRTELKREVYRLHPHCRCVLIVRQDRPEVTLDRRTESGWQVTTFDKLDAVLNIDDFGLRCTLTDLYRGTPLSPRRR